MNRRELIVAAAAGLTMQPAMAADTSTSDRVHLALMLLCLTDDIRTEFLTVNVPVDPSLKYLYSNWKNVYLQVKANLLSFTTLETELVSIFRQFQTVFAYAHTSIPDSKSYSDPTKCPFAYGKPSESDFIQKLVKPTAFLSSRSRGTAK